MFVLREFVGKSCDHDPDTKGIGGSALKRSKWLSESCRLLTTSALALLFCTNVLSSNPAWAEDLPEPVPLRGSVATQGDDDGGPNAPQRDAEPNPVDLRGSYNTAEEAPSLMGDLMGTIAYTFGGLAPLTQLRGSGVLVKDRYQSLDVPDRPSLRHAMLFGALRASSGDQRSEVGNAVSMALRGSYSARALLERARADRERVHAAVGVFLPKLTLSTGLTSENSDTDGAYQDTMTGDLELSVPLYSSGANRNALYQAQSLSLASDYGYLAGEHKVALEAIAAHVNLRLNRSIEKALRKNEKAMKRLLHIATRRYDAGDASRTDIAIAQGNLEGARAERDIARKSREEVAADYKSVVGDLAPGHLAPAHADQLVPDSVEEAIALARRHNPVLIATLHAADASAYAARAERGRYGPKVDLFGTYSQELYTSSKTSEDPDFKVGVRLKVPLVNFAAMPNVMAARHDAMEAGYRALDQEEQIVRQIRRKYIAYKSARRRTQISGRQVRAIQRSVTGTRREYEAGFRSITDVTNGQIKLTRALITKITAQHERMLSGYELAFATGNPEVAKLVLDQ